MITIKINIMTALPCSIKNIRSFAITPCDYIFLTCQGHEIIIWSQVNDTIDSITLKKAYRCICYDIHDDCYWGIAENDTTILRKFDKNFCEMDVITIPTSCHQSANNMSYDQCEHGIWIYYPNKIAFMDTCSGNISWYNDNNMIEHTFASLSHGNCEIDCFCECKRQIMEIRFCCTEEAIEILIPNGSELITIAPCFEMDSDATWFYVIQTNCHSKKCTLFEYCVSLCDQSDSSQQPNNCTPSLPYCGSYEIMHSIALEEAGISHILNAEGEKIQKAVAISDNIQDLICVNESVKRTLTQVTLLEGMLYSKLETLVNCPEFTCFEHDEDKYNT